MLPWLQMYRLSLRKKWTGTRVFSCETCGRQFRTWTTLWAAVRTSYRNCPCKRRLCLHTAHYTLPFSKCVYRKKSIKEVNFAQYELSWCETFVDVNVHYEKIILPVWNFQLLKYLTKLTLSLKIFGKSKNSKFPAGIELLAYRFVANAFPPFLATPPPHPFYTQFIYTYDALCSSALITVNCVICIGCS